MLKVIIKEPKFIQPFNEAARDLRLQNKPLWLHQRDVLTPYITQEIEVETGTPLPDDKIECIVYRDNLFFDDQFLDHFLSAGRRLKKPCRAAISYRDAAFREHALPLSKSYTKSNEVLSDDEIYLVDMWYYPRGIEEKVTPLIIDLKSKEAGYYHIPTYMASDQGDLVFQVQKYSGY